MSLQLLHLNIKFRAEFVGSHSSCPIQGKMPCHPGSIIFPVLNTNLHRELRTRCGRWGQLYERGSRASRQLTSACCARTPWQEASPNFISGDGWATHPSCVGFPCWSARPSLYLQVKGPPCGADPQLMHPWGFGAQDTREGRGSGPEDRPGRVGVPVGTMPVPLDPQAKDSCPMWPRRFHLDTLGEFPFIPSPMVEIHD